MGIVDTTNIKQIYVILFFNRLDKDASSNDDSNDEDDASNQLQIMLKKSLKKIERSKNKRKFQKCVIIKRW